MRKNLLGIICGSFLTLNAAAQSKDPNDYAFMTAKDLKQSSLSNLSIVNRTTNTITASGLFIASYDINDCSACFGNVVAGDNAGGAMTTIASLKPNQSIPIGSNFLYNMLYNGIYFIKNTVGSSPCSLPGCSWPGDDTNVRGWCITINVTSPNSNYTYSNYTNGSNPPANFPAYGAAGNSTPFDYRYDLIDPNTLGSGNACLGPITCDDQTLTCHVASAQSESIQAYS